LYYLSHVISEQGEKGSNWNFDIHPVYGVFFLNFHLKGLKPQSIRTIQLRVDETGEIFSEKLKAYTLELIDFKDKPEAYPKSQIEYWLYNLVNMESMTKALPFQKEQPVFSKMGGISELSHMNSEERRKYFYSLNKYRTNLSVMEYAIKEGLEEGLEKGLKEGLEKGTQKKAIEIARNAKNMGMEASGISKLTGLSISEIEKL
ncbi:MAG: PD-(D/E)XK nuclease family transposase, partial [Alistipes sp.]|nr:PD-(D/E)XK nuclease family transposase [Candidatus Alistipes equi]